MSDLDRVVKCAIHPGLGIARLGPRRSSISRRARRAAARLGTAAHPRDRVGANGPFGSNGPGTPTCLLGVPWQTDAASCDAGYEFGTFLPLPTFLAARVPNHVMPEHAYERFMDVKLPLAQRFKHLSWRPAWLRFFSSQYLSRIRTMVAEWNQIGIVVARRAPADEATFGLGPTYRIFS